MNGDKKKYLIMLQIFLGVLAYSCTIMTILTADAPIALKYFIAAGVHGIIALIISIFIY